MKSVFFISMLSGFPLIATRGINETRNSIEGENAGIIKPSRTWIPDMVTGKVCNKQTCLRCNYQCSSFLNLVGGDYDENNLDYLYYIYRYITCSTCIELLQLDRCCEKYLYTSE